MKKIDIILYTDDNYVLYTDDNYGLFILMNIKLNIHQYKRHNIEKWKKFRILYTYHINLNKIETVNNIRSILLILKVLTFNIKRIFSAVKF